MRKELMIVVAIGLLVVLVGCSTTSTTTDDINSDVATTVDDEEGIGVDEEVDGNSVTMKFCQSTKQTDLFKYEYYWTSDEYFEKVVTGNGGETRKVVTPEKACVFVAGSSVGGWDCSEGSEALFQETKGVVEDLINSPVDVYGLVCKDVAYDVAVFDVSDS